MDKYPNGLTKEEIITGLIKSLRTLGYIPRTANAGSLLRLTTEEVKHISKETGIEEFKIWRYYG